MISVILISMFYWGFMKFLTFISFVSLTVFFSTFISHDIAAQEKKIQSAQPVATSPEFYRGIYLTQPSGKNLDKLKTFVALSKKANINVFVIDAQPAPNSVTSIPKENIQYLLANGIYPIARIVCFSDGLKQYPVPESTLQNKINIAKSACEIGFKEIQFDYIRFEDYGITKKVPLKEKFDFIEGFLARAKRELKPYGVKIAADIFGRIPLNSNDPIGQRLEGLDKVIDVICPMAYPSHYTWSQKMMADPYYTVNLTATKAKDRAKQADIVTYIQAFKIRVNKSSLSYDDYVLQQIKAVHDSKIKGYILWNAAQEYTIPFKVAEEFYKPNSKQSKADTKKKNTVTM
jgi:hypothetical protein